MTDGLMITRTFDAPREYVYEAWTRPEYFSIWFGTDAIDVPLETLSMDVRVGGSWTAVMRLPDGNQIHWVGEYTEVEPPERLAFTITDEPSEPAGAPVTVEFAKVPGGTRMTLVQSRDHLTDEQVELTVIGYNGFFDSMEKVLDERL
ncbi:MULTISPECIES: SRPBCC domain-containing protein [unclassified Salinibacterium]|uniref:SRPBCC family protein n=1 Tax=unclassified Salinibacterium TaxID=2632331 RepID=UPI00142225E0|nr:MULTISPECIES: SRPBCC domain-containing protein [unclassified Salinibacterium]